MGMSLRRVAETVISTLARLERRSCSLTLEKSCFLSVPQSHSL